MTPKQAAERELKLSVTGNGLWQLTLPREDDRLELERRGYGPAPS